MERRQFLYGVVAAGAVALSAPTLAATAAGASTTLGRVPSDSAESFLLSTARQAFA